MTSVSISVAPESPSSSAPALPLVSLLLAQALWATWYAPGIFILIGGIKTQIALLAAWVLSILLLRRSAPAVALARSRTRGVELAALSLFVAVNLLFLMADKGNATRAYAVKSVLLAVICWTSTVQLTDDARRYLQVGVTITLALGILAMIILPIIYLNPGIARFYNYQPDQVVWFGTYGFFMAYAIAFPCFLGIAHAQRGALRVVLYILCAGIVALIAVSTFAASIILMLIGGASLAVMSIRRPSTYVWGAMIIAVALFVLTRPTIAQLPQIQAMSVKISGIFSANPGREENDPNSPQVRAYLTQISVHTFLNHPLLGVGPRDPLLEGNTVIGNHSGLIDGMAEYGLIGIAPYLTFLGLGLRRLIRDIRREPEVFLHRARLTTFVVYIAGSMVNPTFFDAGICTLVFLLALSPLRARAAAAEAW